MSDGPGTNGVDRTPVESEHASTRGSVSATGSYEFRRSERSRRGPNARSRSVIRLPSRTVLMVAAVVVGVLLLSVLGDLAVSSGRIHPGVRVGEVSVGSLTQDQAHAALSDAFSAGAASPVTVVFEKARWTVTASGIGADLDTTASVDAAMAVGRHGSLWTMVAERLGAVFGGIDVASHVTADTDKTDALLDEIDRAVGRQSRDASVAVSPSAGTVTFVRSEAGRLLEREATRRAVLAAFLTKDRTAHVVSVPAGVAVSDVNAQQAYQDAQKLVSGPVTVAYGAKSVNVSRETVASWVVFARRPTIAPAAELSQPSTEATTPGGPVDLANPQSMLLVASFDPARVGAATASLTKGSGRPAKNAAFTVVKGKIKITASQVGLGPDLASLADDLARACVGAGARTAAVKFTQTQPSLTTTAAREMGISDRISSFTTTYATVNPARTSNVHLLAHALDAKLVPPGGTFSFNQTAGERTAAKGYQEAPAIVKGKLVPQLGGGVCQVGTTFFNTVFFSGLPIVERHNHSFFISHYPKGRDATVSWGGPDFKFKNDTKGWILIRTSTTASSITISLYGTDPGYQVDYTTGPFTDVVPHKVIEVKDPKLKKGARIVTDGGVDGCRILVVRTVYKDGAVVRTDRFVSIYSPKDETVRVGTKTASTTPTSTPTP